MTEARIHLRQQQAGDLNICDALAAFRIEGEHCASLKGDGRYRENGRTREKAPR